MQDGPMMILQEVEGSGHFQCLHVRTINWTGGKRCAARGTCNSRGCMKSRNAWNVETRGQGVLARLLKRNCLVVEVFGNCCIYDVWRLHAYATWYSSLCHAVPR